jgi:hypothetical protein
MRKKYFLVLSRQKNLYQRDSKNIKSFYFLAKFLKTQIRKTPLLSLSSKKIILVLGFNTLKKIRISNFYIN